VESGTPADLLENSKDEDAMNMLALLLVVNFDEWAPQLFRAMNTERTQERRYRERFLSTGDIESLSVVNETENTERVAILKKVISNDEFQRFGKQARPIVDAYLKDPGATQEEISKELGVSQKTVSQILKKIRFHLTAS
jgi:RNA polymerase sigma factor (sigma-70 family)